MMFSLIAFEYSFGTLLVNPRILLLSFWAILLEQHLLICLIFILHTWRQIRLEVMQSIPGTYMLSPSTLLFVQFFLLLFTSYAATILQLKQSYAISQASCKMSKGTWRTSGSLGFSMLRFGYTFDLERCCQISCFTCWWFSSSSYWYSCRLDNGEGLQYIYIYI